MKKAVVVGYKGQDGRIITDHLKKRDYFVVGVGRKLKPSDIDITNSNQVSALIKKHKPDEIYYLAAHYHSSEIRENDYLESIRLSYDANVLGLANFLESIRVHSNESKLFYASSSLIFTGTNTLAQDETTPTAPTSIYGITKQDGLQLCRLYRREHGVFASVGILYNHESNYRPDSFVSMKIIKSAIDIKNKGGGKLILGDLSAEIDWGYAPDFVAAFYLILNLPYPDDFIIATGIKKTVKDFVEIAFGYLGLDWRKYVIEDRTLVKKRRALVGNPKKLIQETGWHPTVDFKGMIKKIIRNEGVKIDD